MGPARTNFNGFWLYFEPANRSCRLSSISKWWYSTSTLIALRLRPVNLWSVPEIVSTEAKQFKVLWCATQTRDANEYPCWILNPSTIRANYRNPFIVSSRFMNRFRKEIELDTDPTFFSIKIYWDPFGFFYEEEERISQVLIDKVCPIILSRWI